MGIEGFLNGDILYVGLWDNLIFYGLLYDEGGRNKVLVELYKLILFNFSLFISEEW